MRWLHIASALFRDGGPSGIVINTGRFEHIGFAIFAIETAGALVRGVLLRRLIIQAALRARKHDRGLCYGGHPAIMRRWLASSIRNCPGFEWSGRRTCDLCLSEIKSGHIRDAIRR